MSNILKINLNRDNFPDVIPIHFPNKEMYYVKQFNSNIFDLEYIDYDLKVRLEDLSEFEIEYLEIFVINLQVENL
jgi:hypothetical protein